MYIQIQMDWIQVLTTVNPLPFSRSRARWVEEEEKSSRYFCSVGSRIFLNKTINKTPWAISLTWIKSLYRKAHLRKATIKLITRKNFIFFRIEWSLFVKTYSNLVKIGQMSLNKILKIRQCIFATSWLSPIGNGLALNWAILISFHPRILCAKYDWSWPSCFGENEFLISSKYFCYFVIISPWKLKGPFIWTNLNPLHMRMLCAIIDWNWPSGSWKEDENVNSLQTDGGTTDNRQSEKPTWAYSSGELKGRHFWKWIYLWTIWALQSF